LAKDILHIISESVTQLVWLDDMASSVLRHFCVTIRNLPSQLTTGERPWPRFTL